MPLYVGYTQKRRRVKLYTAGENVYLLIKTLGGTYDLQAVINDETNLRNYELLWEQLTGEPVELSSVNTLSSSFRILDRTDKLFKFSLDLGTNQEQSEEITVYFTPTSEHQFYGGAVNRNNEDNVTKRNQKFEPGYILEKHSGEFNPNVPVISSVGITVDQPTSGMGGLVVNTTLYGAPGEWTHTPSEIIYDIPSLDGKMAQFFAVDWGSYILEVTYNIGTINPVKYRSTPIFAKPDQVGSKGYKGNAVDEILNAHNGASVNKISNVRKFVSLARNQESLYQFSKGGNQNKVNALVKYINKTMNPLESSFHILPGSGGLSPSKVTNVKRINPSAIGSS